jgi:hypothetical protein
MKSQVAEQTALAEVAHRLIQEFPEAEPAAIDDAISQAAARFAASPIRDFIPLFVEKHARHTLAQHRVVTSA